MPGAEQKLGHKIGTVSQAVLLFHTPGNHQPHVADHRVGSLKPQHWQGKELPRAAMVSSVRPPPQPRPYSPLRPVGSLSLPRLVLGEQGCPCTDSSLEASSGVLEKAEAQVTFVVSAGITEASWLLAEEREAWKGNSARNGHAGGLASCVLPKKPGPGYRWPGEHRPPASTASCPQCGWGQQSPAGLSAPEHPPSPAGLPGPALPSSPATFPRADGQSGCLCGMSGHGRPSYFQVFICEPEFLTVRSWTETSLGLNPHFSALGLWPGGLNPPSLLFLICKMDMTVFTAMREAQPVLPERSGCLSKASVDPGWMGTLLAHR